MGFFGGAVKKAPAAVKAANAASKKTAAASTMASTSRTSTSTSTSAFAALYSVRRRYCCGSSGSVLQSDPSSLLILLERRLLLLQGFSGGSEAAISAARLRLFSSSGRRFSSSNSSTSTEAGSATAPPLSASGLFFFGSLCVGTFALGCWQTSRLFEKQQMVEQRTVELEQPPLLISSSSLQEEIIKPGSFRRLVLEGRYDHAREMLVGPRGAPASSSSNGASSSSYGGSMPSPQGYFVVTPFVTHQGDVVLVNRGWVPRTAVVPSMSLQQQQQQQHRRREREGEARTGPGSRPASSSSAAAVAARSPPQLLQWSRPTGTTTVRAVPSVLEKPRFLVANHNYRERPVQLYWFDVEAMRNLVQREGAPLVTAYVDAGNRAAAEDENEEGGKSGGGQDLLRPARPTLESLQEFKVSPAIHAAYAFTWFSLSLAGLVMTRRLAGSGSALGSASASASAAAAATAAVSRTATSAAAAAAARKPQ